MTTSESELSLPAVALNEAAAVRSAKRRGRRPTFWRIREDIPWRLEAGLIGLSLLLPLAAWTVLAQSHVVNPIFLPAPWAVAEAGYEMLTSGELLRDTVASVRRVGIGFGLSLLIAIPVGLGIGTFRSVRALFEPFVGMVRYAPATAFVPLLVIWLGLGEEPKIALVVIGTVFFNTLMIANAVWSVPSELIRVSQTLGAGSASVFRKVILPHSLPGIIDSARVNLAAAWNLIVVTEVFAAEEGLGFRIVRAQKFLHIDQIFVAIVVIGVLGVAADFGLRTLRNRLAPWSQE